MSNVLDAMLDGTTMELPSGGQGQPYSRAAVLITQTQLAHLVSLPVWGLAIRPKL